MSTNVYLSVDLDSDLGPAVLSMLNSYARHYQMTVVASPTEADWAWVYGPRLPAEVGDLPCHWFCPQYKMQDAFAGAAGLPQSPGLGQWERKLGPALHPKGLRADPYKRCQMWNLDLLGAMALVLYRAEEHAPDAQEMQKGWGQTSWLRQLGLDQNPWVDLWMKWLWADLARIAGKPAPKTYWEMGSPAVWLSHDIDKLQKWHPRKSLGHCASFVWRFWDPQWWSTVWQMQKSWAGQDPLDQLQWLSALEKDKKSTFFALAWPKDHLGSVYDLLKPRFRKSLAHITERGLDLGWHCSPLHAADAPGLDQELDRAKQVVNPQWTRFHYLFWDHQHTPKLLEQQKVELDSTLGWNDAPGFRCGTAMPFVWFDLSQNVEMKWVEMPFAFADHQVQDLMANADPKLWELAHDYARRAHAGGGVAAYLWHDLYMAPEMAPGHREYYVQWLDQMDHKGVSYLGVQDLLRNSKAKI